MHFNHWTNARIAKFLSYGQFFAQSEVLRLHFVKNLLNGIGQLLVFFGNGVACVVG